jgi:hypothetical protein
MHFLCDRIAVVRIVIFKLFESFDASIGDIFRIVRDIKQLSVRGGGEIEIDR